MNLSLLYFNYFDPLDYTVNALPSTTKKYHKSKTVKHKWNKGFISVLEWAFQKDFVSEWSADSLH